MVEPNIWNCWCGQKHFALCTFELLPKKSEETTIYSLNLHIFALLWAIVTVVPITSSYSWQLISPGGLCSMLIDRFNFMMTDIMFGVFMPPPSLLFLFFICPNETSCHHSCFTIYSSAEKFFLQWPCHPWIVIAGYICSMDIFPWPLVTCTYPLDPFGKLA